MNRSSLTFLLLAPLVLAACIPPPPAADLQVPSLFTDHMVLQRDKPITFWGWAEPDTKVAVSIAGQTDEAFVGRDSTWHLTLGPFPAGGPHELVFAATDTLVFTDVLFGDVWIASGQSNMEWPLSQTQSADRAMRSANYPAIRLFKVNRTVSAQPERKVGAEGWRAATPETVPDFSAIAYYFGRKLHQELDVPIGLIQTAWGGTPAEAWTSAEALQPFPSFQASIQELARNPGALAGAAGDYAASVARWLQSLTANDAGYAGPVPAWAAPEMNDSNWPTMPVPELWESTALPDFDGIVWYRTAFDLPEGWTAQDLTLALGPIDDIDSTWVNGVLVGGLGQYNAPRSYSVPSGLLQSKNNVIAVRVVDTGGGGGFWGEAGSMQLTPQAGIGQAPLSLDGEWRYQIGLDFSVGGTDRPTPPLQAQNQPTTLYNAMIAPLLPYAIKGAIWYQGESNADRAYQYRSLFTTMIQDWRSRWNQGDFPFLFVQLANFMAPQKNPIEAETWPELREAQTQALSLPNTGMAVIIDIGEADDIHPRNKVDVGLRLARPALRQIYGREMVEAGPLYREMQKEEGAIRLLFDHVGSGLVLRADTLSGFALAGPDSVWFWAEARIDGESVLVSSPEVADPVAVRYAWANNPIISLFNQEGLPASPFRTDDFPMITR